MALHVRRQLVLAVVAALEGRTAAGNSVYAGRAAPLAVSRAPFLLVYARQEQSGSTANSGDDRRLQRQLVLAVDAVTSDAGDDDGLADALALEVEIAMAADTTLGGLALDLELSRTDLNAGAEGESRTGRARLEFTVEYHTAADRPDTSLQ